MSARGLVARISVAIFLGLAVGSSVVLVPTIAVAGCTYCR